MIAVDQGVGRVCAGDLGRELAEREQGCDNAGGVGRQFARKPLLFTSISGRSARSGQVKPPSDRVCGANTRRCSVRRAGAARR